MRSVATATVCLRKMIVENERNNYLCDGTAGRSRLYNEDVHGDIKIIYCSPEDAPLSVRDSVFVLDDINLKGKHKRFVGLLFNHK